MGTIDENGGVTYTVDELLAAAQHVLGGVIDARSGKVADEPTDGGYLTVRRVDKGCPPPEVVEVSRVDKGCPPPRQLTDLAPNNNETDKKRALNRIQDVIILLDAAKTMLDPKEPYLIDFGK